MFWCVVLGVIGFLILLLLTYLMTRGKITDIPQGWHPPGGDHTAEWINEHSGKPRSDLPRKHYSPRGGDYG